MNKLPVSVHILTYNSGSTLQKALQSVRDCAEILVIDGGSTDDTLAIAKQHHAQILQQQPGGPAEDFSAIRNQALHAATQPWIFALDSDESATPELMAAIAKATRQQPAAYHVHRKYVLPDGRVVDHASTYPNKRVYFFHRESVKGWIKPVHERPALQPGATVKELRGACLAPIGEVADYKQKNERYLRLEIQKSAGKGWGHWLAHRLLHTIRSRLIGLLRLLRIWLVPRRGVRLPLRHELLRFWYGWQLIVRTCPLTRRASRRE